jgi:undecaprenyl-phosphate 4-deoxy-4-formamido-L-arabinose transferase
MPRESRCRIFGIETRTAPIEISVVVPVFNSEGTLETLVSRLHRTLANVPFEVVFVDDGSPDSSWSVIRALAEKYPEVRGIRLMRNYGQHNAILAGVRAARGDVIVTMDDDLQHPPEEVPRLLEELSRGYDVVYGTPRNPPHSRLRNVASWITKLALQKTMGAETARHVSAFRAFRASLRRAFERYQSPFVSIDVVLTWGTLRFSAIPVEHLARAVGRSNYTFRSLVVHALTVATGFSTLPLRLASLMGFSFTILGGAVFLFVVGRYLFGGGSVPGFPFLASIIAIFSGAQFFALGIIGEYLARMHARMMERPTYSVAENLPALQESRG